MMGRAASIEKYVETVESMAMAPLHTFPGGTFAVSEPVQLWVHQFFATFHLRNILR